MSHRHRIETKITDMNIAKQALTAAKIEFREQGSQLFLTSGSLRDTVIDTTTGRITSGDTDYTRVTHNDVEILQQHYSVALIKHRAVLEGHTIESESSEFIQGRGDCRVLILQRA